MREHTKKACGTTIFFVGQKQGKAVVSPEGGGGEDQREEATGSGVNTEMVKNALYTRKSTPRSR